MQIKEIQEYAADTYKSQGISLLYHGKEYLSKYTKW